MDVERFTRSHDLSSSALWSLTAVVLMESMRALFPILFDTREDSGAAVAVGIAVAVFGVGPLLGSLLRRGAGAARAMRISVGALVAGRLTMQFVDPIPVWLVALTVAVGLGTLAIQLSTARARGRAAVFALAILTGLSLDAVIRGAFSTWDMVWQDGAAATIVALLVSVALAVSAVAAPGHDGPPTSPAMGPTWSVVLLGPFFALEVLYLQNVAFATSEAGIDLPTGIAIVLLGSAVGIGVAAVAAAGPTPWARVLSAVVVVLGIAALALIGGRSVAVVLPLTQTASAVLLLLAIAARTHTIRKAWRSELAVSLGMLLFVGAIFAYMIDIDVPLLFPRSTWPIAAAVVLALSSAASINPVRLTRTPALIPAFGAIAIPLALFATAPTLATEPAGGASVRLIDWNIHGAVNADGQVDMAAIADVIGSQDPDVVVLQEVGRGWPIAGQTDQAEWLSRRLDMYLVWASAADGQFGNAILTRAPPSDVRVAQLPYGEGPQQRSAVGAKVPVGDGGELRVIDAHLQNGDVPATREQQIEAVLELWDDEPSAVIAGDLNMQPTEDNVALFETAGLVSVQDEIGDASAPTARDPAFPGDRVDWIWTASGVEASDFTFVETDASDHLPLVVTLVTSA